jgi:hypothetical protein
MNENPTENGWTEEAPERWIRGTLTLSYEGERSWEVDERGEHRMFVSLAEIDEAYAEAPRPQVAPSLCRRKAPKAGNVVLRRIALSRLGMTEQQARAFATALNEAQAGSSYADAVVTNDGALCIDADLISAMEEQGVWTV